MLRKDRGLLVKIRSIQVGFSEFLKHVGCLMRLFKLYELQKFLIVSSSTHTLKSPRSIMFSYFVENASNALLIISRWCLMLFLLALHEQFISHFFLWSIISTKKHSPEGKSWLKNLVGISSRTYDSIPLHFYCDKIWKACGIRQLKIDHVEKCHPLLIQISWKHQ